MVKRTRKCETSLSTTLPLLETPQVDYYHSSHERRNSTIDKLSNRVPVHVHVLITPGHLYLTVFPQRGISYESKQGM